MTDDPQTPDEETPTNGDVSEPEQSADPGEAPAAEAAEEPKAEEPTAEAEQPAADEPSDAEAQEAGGPVETQAESDGAAVDAQTESPEAASPDAPAEPSADEAAAGEPAPAAEAAAEGEGEAAADGESAAERRERPKPKAKGKKGDSGDAPEVVPGAHLEPDLVLESEAAADDPYASYTYDAEGEDAAGAVDADGEPIAEAPAPYKPKDLAADARYHATGKRKTAVARVILKPGTGTYTVNGKSLEVFFPRVALQNNVKAPLTTAGYQDRMDVVVKIHGGGVSSQAGALRHGIARALTEADPNLRGEMKKRGFLTRDARVKERKKAGLKKARKRPQFSKR
jgi:small subunit ribosomal protein S9